MKILKARIKKSSPNYEMGLNQKAKPVWLSITGFNPNGKRNFRINAIKGIKEGFAVYKEIWCSPDELTFKHIEDAQLSMELYSREEMEKQKYNPKLFNRCRFEVTTQQEKQYIQAPDLKTAKQIAEQLGIVGGQIRQINRQTKKDIND